MKKKLVKGLFMDGCSGEYKEVECENSCDGFYKLLDCDYIDIQERKIGNNYYDIIFDDESRLKNMDEIDFGVVTLDGSGRVCETILGKVLITKSNIDGETISLDPENLVEIIENIHEFTIRDVKNNRIKKKIAIFAGL